MAAILALAGTASPVGAQSSAQATAAADQEYAARLAQLKRGGVEVDFVALREAYAKSSHYNPYGGHREAQAMISSFNAGNCAATLETAAKVLDDNYLDLDAHYLSARCLARAGEEDKANLHVAVYVGLLDAIAASGDGKSPATAYQVLSVAEEYAVIRRLKRRPVGQALIDSGGHAFDKMDVTDEAGQTSSLYFNVDLLLAREAKLLGK